MKLNIYIELEPQSIGASSEVYYDGINASMNFQVMEMVKLTNSPGYDNIDYPTCKKYSSALIFAIFAS